MKSGFSLLEVLVSLAIFGLVSLVGMGGFLYSVKAWKTVTDKSTAVTTLRKVSLRLESDLLQSSLARSRSQVAGATLGGAPDGDAIWFLNAGSPFLRDPQGEPLWQRNVLYYVTVPTPLESVSGGLAFSGAPGADGYEDRCPHKVLIRKVIDGGTTTTPTSDPEELLADISPYLTRPQGLSTQNMSSEPGVERAEIVAHSLLSFQVRAQHGGYQFDLKAVRLGEARRHLALGTALLSDSPYAVHSRFLVIPQN